MALEIGVNSYVDVAYADAYFAGKLFADEWNGADGATKERALQEATRRIDRLTLTGTKADPAQPLEFPRAYCTADGRVVQSDVPDAVRRAVCEEALALLRYANSARTRAQEQGVRRVQVGSLAEDYAPPRKLLSSEALELLRPYLAGAVSIC